MEIPLVYIYLDEPFTANSNTDYCMDCVNLSSIVNIDFNSPPYQRGKQGDVYNKLNIFGEHPSVSPLVRGEFY